MQTGGSKPRFVYFWMDAGSVDLGALLLTALSRLGDSRRAVIMQRRHVYKCHQRSL